MYNRAEFVAVRLMTGTALFLIACLLVCGKALAEPVPAEHNYLVHQCIERTRLEDAAINQIPRQGTAATNHASIGQRSTSQDAEPPPETYSVLCEQWQKAIDGASASSRLGEPVSRSQCCLDRCAPGESSFRSTLSSACTTFGAQEGTGADARSTGTTGISSRFGTNLASDRSSSICNEAGCLSTFRSGNPLDTVDFQRNLQLQGLHGSDRMADLIHPGFGRWETSKGGVNYRIDYLNTHRCKSAARLGLCLSVTIP